MNEVLARIDQWLADGRFLIAIGDYLRQKPDRDVDRLRVFVTKAIKRDEQVPVAAAGTIAAIWYQRTADQALVFATQPRAHGVVTYDEAFNS